jgi:Ran-binding protein 3
MHSTFIAVQDEATEPEVPNEANGRAKKNRVYESAEEAEIKRSSRMTSRSPPGSPPPEPKMVRQISQGVEDLTWKSSEQSGGADKTSTPGDDSGEESGEGRGGLSLFDSGPLARTEAENIDKSLKRKFEERGTSQGPIEGNGPKMPSETLKRARDDANDDPNPRQTKRPTPPPDESNPSVTRKLSDTKENGTIVTQELPYPENKKATTVSSVHLILSAG